MIRRPANSFDRQPCLAVVILRKLHYGFFEKLLPTIHAGSVAMDRFHQRNPFPGLAGFTAELPNIGL